MENIPDDKTIAKEILKLMERDKKRRDKCSKKILKSLKDGDPKKELLFQMENYTSAQEERVKKELKGIIGE